MFSFVFENLYQVAILAPGLAQIYGTIRRSEIAKIINFICCKYNNKLLLTTIFLRMLTLYLVIPNMHQNRLSGHTNIPVSIIEDLMYMRENISHFVIDVTEINDMIHYNMCVL